MTKLTRRMSVLYEKIKDNKNYNIDDAFSLLRNTSSVKFIESVDAAINLGIDARKSDQIVRGTVVLPHGTGRTVRVAVFAQGDNIDIARKAGADIVDSESLIAKIKKREINFDVIIATPDLMHLVSPLGVILGPRGIMPNPKFGTVTYDISTAIKNAKNGQVNFRNEKNGIIHTTIGKLNFENDKLKENLESLLIAIKKLKPNQTKGIYFKSINISTTMGIGIRIDQTSLNITK